MKEQFRTTTVFSAPRSTKKLCHMVTIVCATSLASWTQDFYVQSAEILFWGHFANLLSLFFCETNVCVPTTYNNSFRWLATRKTFKCNFPRGITNQNVVKCASHRWGNVTHSTRECNGCAETTRVLKLLYANNRKKHERSLRANHLFVLSRKKREDLIIGLHDKFELWSTSGE